MGGMARGLGWPDTTEANPQKNIKALAEPVVLLGSPFFELLGLLP